MGLTTVHPGGEVSVDLSVSLEVGDGDDSAIVVLGSSVSSALVAVAAASLEDGSWVSLGEAPWQAANITVSSMVINKIRFFMFAP